MKKRFAAFLAIILALSALFPMARAAEAGQFLQGYQVRDGQMLIFCRDLAKGDYQLTLDGQVLPAEISTVAQESIPVTVYCLVDVSGSMHNSQMEQVYEALRTISAFMGEEDNMVISALGNSTVSSGLLTTAQQREDAITALQRVNEDTNLYAGIVESLKLLQTDTSFHTKRCLIILSDGEDYQDTGFVEQEVITAIQDACLPIYTIATLRQNPTQNQKEFAKLLGSFARYSVGGLHSAPVVDRTTAAEAGEKIWNSIENGVILVPDFSEFQLDNAKSDVLMKVVYTAGATQLEDALTIPADEIPVAEQNLPQETDHELGREESSESDPLDSIEGESSPSDSKPGRELDKAEPSWLLIIPVAAAAIALAGIGGFFFLRKRKKTADSSEPEPEPVPEKTSLLQNQIPNTAPVNIAPGRSASAGCTIIMTALGHADKVCRVELHDKKPITIGRDQSRVNIVLDHRDSRLSGIHCQLMRDGKKLYVMDQGSTNGSFINGIPIQGKGWMPLAEGETLRVGSNEYRVKFHFDS